jgi:site-specific DNA recombinase
MLTNRFYVGVVPYRGEEYPGKHQAIIPEELYQQVQLRRAKHGRKNTRGGITGTLQGMLSCSWCGNPIHSERNYHGDPRYRERHGWPARPMAAR